MSLTTMNILLCTLGASGILAGADLPRPPAIPPGDVVILQGQFSSSRTRPWTVYQNGATRDLGPSEYFALPRDLDLVAPGDVHRQGGASGGRGGAFPDHRPQRPADLPPWPAARPCSTPWCP
jgi:hypothetical protein